MENNFKVDNKSIGQKIRKERENLKLSREEFAEIIGLSDYYVGQLERGERQMSLPVLVKVSSILRLSLDYLIFGENNINAVMDSSEDYTVTELKLKEITNLLEKCSSKELDLFKKLISTILPHLLP